MNISDAITGNINEKVAYDHFLNLISFKLRNLRKRNAHIKTRDIRNYDENEFREDLMQLDLTEHAHLSTNKLTQIFHKHFMKAYNTYK